MSVTGASGQEFAVSGTPDLGALDAVFSGSFAISLWARSNVNASGQGADLRYTAEARIWCGLALGLLAARDLFTRGLLQKEGGRVAMDHFFHQVSRGLAPQDPPDLPGA